MLIMMTKEIIVLICNGPPLDYYMFSLGRTGNVRFSGLLRGQDVKPSQAKCSNAKDMGQV